MINIGQEHLIPIREVPRRLPPRPTGKRVHVSVVYRWIQRGIQGVRLESIRIGGITYTSMEALQRFAEQLTEPGHATGTKPTTAAAREKQIERAEREVQAILGGGRAKGTPK